MQFLGFQKISLIDYPGQIVAIAFTGGCNFRCPFCHNPELVLPELMEDEQVFSEEEILDYLGKRKGFLDGISITGGEPTMHSELPEFIRKVKALEMVVKLDTNGTNPEMIKELINKKLVDYLAMDIKNSLVKYAETVGLKEAGFKILKSKIQKSIKLVMKSGLDYEFRTTVLPRLHSRKDIEAIGKLIKGAKNFYIQNFRLTKTLDPEYLRELSFTENELGELKKIADKYVKSCKIRQ